VWTLKGIPKQRFERKVSHQKIRFKTISWWSARPIREGALEIGGKYKNGSNSRIPGGKSGERLRERRPKRKGE